MQTKIQRVGVILSAAAIALLGVALLTSMSPVLAHLTSVPTADSFYPADDATNVPFGNDLQITFSDVMTTGSGHISIGVNLSDTVVPAYDESDSGDLSGVYTATDSISVAPGTNVISGSVGNNGGSGATDGSDADYFSLTVPNGSSLDSIRIESYTFAPADPNQSFFGYVAGSSFTGQSGGEIDAYVLFNASSGEVLDDLAGGPLSPGTYSFWLQEISDNVMTYTISFRINPDPTTIPVTDSQVSIAGSVVTVNPTADLQPDTDYYIGVDEGAFEDLAGDAFAGFTDTTTWNFTTASQVFSIGPNAADQQEGDSGTVGLTFTVSRTGLTSGAVSVDYAVSGSSNYPADAADFGGTLPTGTVNFGDGQSTETVTINVSGDTDSEPDERFAVTLSNPSAGAALTDPAIGIIRDDDDTISPTLSMTDTVPIDPINVDASIVITFDEPITTGSGDITLTLDVTNTVNVAYNEITMGDFISDFTAPDEITLVGGINLVTGTMGLNGYTGAIQNADNDADFFFFQLPSDYTVESMTVDRYQFSPADPGESFLGYVRSISFNSVDPMSLDGCALFNETDIMDVNECGISGASSDDLLDYIASGTLSPAFHSFWVQETSGNMITYTFAIEVTPPPIVISVDDPQVSIDGNRLILSPDPDLLPNAAYSVQIEPGAVEDLSGNRFGGLADTTTYRFTTGPILYPIYAPVISTP